MNKKTILVVDDNKDTVMLLSSLLTASGFNVITAADGGGVIRAFRETKPDLITLDIDLGCSDPSAPRWDGFNVMAWMHSFAPAFGVPVVVVSGTEQTSGRRRAAALGAYGFLPKPFQKDDLMTLVRDALEARSNAVQMAMA